MSTVFKVLGVVFLLGVLGLGGILYCAHRTGSSLQDDFFAAVLSGDVAAVEAQLHADARADLDRPVLAAWMAAVKEHLGAYEGMSASSFNTSINQVGGKTEVTSKGTVKFAKGEAESTLRAVDDLIVAFHVTSSALPDVWLTKLEDTSIYEERAKQFLRALVSADVAGSLALMHENLRKRFEKDAAYGDALEKLKARFGADAPLQLLSATLENDESPELIVRYAVRSRSERAIGRVRFGFEGLRGHLLGFAMPEG